MHLMEILRRKKLKLKLKKIKAHSGNKFNEMADSLAKEGRELSEILWKDPKNPIWFVLPTWNQIIIDRSTKDFLKEFHKIETTTEWTQQNRMIERWSHEIKNYKNYSWNSFWKQCRQGNIFQTSPKQAKERNFKIKIISNELSMLETLQKRRPDLYKRKSCIQCDTQTETTNHLFEYTASVKIQKEIWNKLQEKIEVKVQMLKEKDKGDTNNQEKIKYKNLIKLVQKWKAQCINSDKNWINIGLGLLGRNKLKEWKEETEKNDLKRL